MEEITGTYPYETFHAMDIIDYALGKKVFDYQAFLDAVKEFEKRGLTEGKIAKEFGLIKIAQLRQMKYIARYKLKEASNV